LTLTAFTITIVCIALVPIEECSAFWPVKNWAREKAFEEGEDGKNYNFDYSGHPRNHTTKKTHI